MVDLHAHTTASDGSFSPSELVALAKKRGLSAVGVTDHDTMGGWAEAFEAGEKLGVEIVPGVELSTAYVGGKFHLIGYYVAPDSRLADVLLELQRARAERNDIILDNLRVLKVPLSLDDVRAQAGDDAVLGRPHFALAMVKKGYVKTVKEAFDRFLADGGVAYAPKQVLEPREAIALIHEAGGVAVWAHPPLSKLSLDELSNRAREWVDWDLDGLEVRYSSYTSESAAWCARIREQYDLLGTGGSDFHGISKPHVQLGVTDTGGPLPYEVLTQLKARRDQKN